MDNIKARVDDNIVAVLRETLEDAYTIVSRSKALPYLYRYSMLYGTSRLAETSKGFVAAMLDDLVLPNKRIDLWLTNVHRRHDVRTLHTRYLSEGLPFATKVLPSIGKYYDSAWQAWNQPQIIECSVSVPQGMKTTTLVVKLDNSSLRTEAPLFTSIYGDVVGLISSLWSHCRSSTLEHHRRARLLELVHELVPIVKVFRTFYFLLYKMETSFTSDQLDRAVEKYRSVEEDIAPEVFGLSWFDEDVIAIRNLLEEVLPASTLPVFTDIKGNHGNGAVAGGETQVEKWNGTHYYSSLHRVYPRYMGLESQIARMRSGAAILNPSDLRQFVTTQRFEEPCSRTLFVPKDSRGPRTIACEPKELMWVQQGVMVNLMKHLHTCTRGHINFEDQTVNRELARLGSRSDSWATVDLEDASDRVSCTVVQMLFPQWVQRYLTALRSPITRLPGGEILRLNKFAPMGSAICFPIESLLFWAIGIRAAVCSGMDDESARSAVYVYGDDIITHPRVVPYLKRLLERFRLRVNSAKTFTTGPFRESCGIDALAGYDVTPLRIRKDVRSRSIDGQVAQGVLAYASVAFLHDWRRLGNWLSDFCHAALSRFVKKTIRVPRIPSEGNYSFLHIVDPRASWESFFNDVQARWSTTKCSLVGSVWTVRNNSREGEFSPYGFLLRALEYGPWDERPPSMVATRAFALRKQKVALGTW